jgi:hypothetical protein
VEIKVRIRIIKILNGTCKAALSSIAASSSSNISNNNASSSSQLQVHPRVKDLVTTNPLSSAVMECCDVDSIAAGILKAASSSNSNSRVSREDIATLANFAVQLRDLSRRL